MNLQSISAASDKGPFLEINEDYYLHDLSADLYMVLDGFGGSGIGDWASQQVAKDIEGAYGTFAGDPDSTMPFFYSARYLLEGNSLINAVHRAHKNLLEYNIARSLDERAGVCGIFLAKSEHIMSLINIGNCRAYLYRNRQLIKIFQDDSYMWVAQNPSFNNFPMNALGLYENLYFEVREIRLEANDQFLLLSDGVYHHLTDALLQDALLRPDLSNKEKIEHLFSDSNSHGNIDNQTAMILSF